MGLKIQLCSLGFSFIFGILFSILLKINYKILFTTKKHIQIISNFLFLLDVSLFYFLGIKFINNGIIHIYFLLIFFIGWYMGNTLLNIFLKK